MAARTRRPAQLGLPLRFWGGKRRNAGRKPKGNKAGVAHVTRPRLGKNQPVHVTLRVRRDVPNLRGARVFRVLKSSFAASCVRTGFRLTHFAVLGNHAHLIVEADEARCLSRGMQGLCTRMAMRLNRQSSRRGAVFADRFHAHVLRTPREVKNAVHYVQHNYRRHFGAAAGWVDPRSSWGTPGAVCSPLGWLLRRYEPGERSRPRCPVKLPASAP
jgi:putative transposase